jgi:hypothetical protein
MYAESGQGRGIASAVAEEREEKVTSGGRWQRWRRRRCGVHVRGRGGRLASTLFFFERGTALLLSTDPILILLGLAHSFTAHLVSSSRRDSYTPTRSVCTGRRTPPCAGMGRPNSAGMVRSLFLVLFSFLCFSFLFSVHFLVFLLQHFKNV